MSQLSKAMRSSSHPLLHHTDSPTGTPDYCIRIGELTVDTCKKSIPSYINPASVVQNTFCHWLNWLCIPRPILFLFLHRMVPSENYDSHARVMHAQSPPRTKIPTRLSDSPTRTQFPDSRPRHQWHSRSSRESLHCSLGRWKHSSRRVQSPLGSGWEQLRDEVLVQKFHAAVSVLPLGDVCGA